MPKPLDTKWAQSTWQICIIEIICIYRYKSIRDTTIYSRNQIEDVRINKLAMLSSWLGNDEVYYTRRWEDKDIEDLKVLITLTASWITNVLISDRHIEEMDNH